MFNIAFFITMQFEIGPQFNAEDPDIIEGKCVTTAQKRKVGYVNDPDDSGGLTKYGVAQNKNPDVDVQNLDLDGALEIYKERYWLAGGCDSLPLPIAIFHFDCCVNHGVSRANKMLQAVAPHSFDESPTDICGILDAYATRRENFYRAIVQRRPSQSKYMKGWMRRCNEVHAAAKKALDA